jgi:serine/threonine protein phosphatase 1
MSVELFSLNTAGRDFICGDVHGHFELLSRALENYDFCTHTDRLFSVGDLVNKGPYSEQALWWLAQPWFHAVRGNHEEFLLQAAGLKQKGLPPHSGHGRVSLDWFYQLSTSAQGALLSYMEALPHALEVATPLGAVVALHGDLPTRTWAEAKELLQTGDDALQHQVVWGRSRARGRRGGPVADVYRVYLGHTPMPELTQLDNVWLLDTGASRPAASAKLTVVPLY